MSVLIRGMQIQDNCKECRMRTDYDFCSAMPKEFCGYTNDIRRPDWCPLVEIKTPHGDLIDRQKLIEDNKHLEYPTDGKYRRDRAWAVGFNAGARHCNEHAVYAKTVIEAEGAEK